MSKFGGGLWLDFDGSHRHDDHQNGTDADFRYLRKDGADQYLYIDQTPDQYDTLATADLFRCIIEHGNVSYILVDSADLGFSIPGYTMNYPGHNTHFHVTIDRP